MTAAPAPQTTAPPALWRIARAFICVLHDLFGAPSDIARAHSLTHAAYKILLSWIQVGEAMMRRLIAIEAAAFPKPNTRPLMRASRKRARRMMEFWPETPDDWRVSFRCFTSSPASSGGSAERRSRKAKGQLAPSDAFGVSSPARGGDAAPIFHSAWPLAERFEALIRVFNNPLAAARRLSARLHARPHTLAAVLAAPEAYKHRVDHAHDFDTYAERAWSVRHDSS
jgi:hypothetical protein